MKEIKRKKIDPCRLHPGDVIEIIYTNGKGKKYKVLAERITDEKMLISTIIIFELEDDDFNLEAGCAVIGRGKKK
jgi:hypothetical protein